MELETKELYDAASSSWVRKSPISLSDFTGRPFLFEECGEVEGSAILDLGCGEGYCARHFAARGAAIIDGIDISPKMIEAAKRGEYNNTYVSFSVGNITSLSPVEAKYDKVIGCFVYNYLSIEETYKSMAEVHRVLKNGGKFIFCVPHPAFPFIKRKKTHPFFFDFGRLGYFSGRNTRSYGKIWRRDGLELPVEMHHKLISDYFDALKLAGFNLMPRVKELGVTAKILKIDEKFFSPLADVPLHMLFSVTKAS